MAIREPTPADQDFDLGNGSRGPALRPSFQKELDIDQVKSSFLDRYTEYAVQKAAVEELRALEYSQLDIQQQVYLDNTGSALASEKQIADHASILRSSILGNPHSSNPTSTTSDHLAEQARHEVLRFFNTSKSEYTVIFTANATGAFKLVGECYPFRRNKSFLLCADNHNSVSGIQCFAQHRGAVVKRVPLTGIKACIDEHALEKLLKQGRNKPGLFAYPAQSNLTGVRHSLDWVKAAQMLGWHVLLDIAAYAPTCSLDLQRYNPDFLACSFYKMFGYPTGVGCLLVHKTALSLVETRPWYAGGTVTMVYPDGKAEMLPADSHSRWEDGTINFSSLPAVTMGLQHLKRVGMSNIGARTACLTSWLLEHMLLLCHRNGTPAVRVYGPTGMEKRGPTIAFNILTPQGMLVPLEDVQSRANCHAISLRTGCMCNPIAGWHLLLNSSPRELQGWFPVLTKEPNLTANTKVSPSLLVSAVKNSIAGKHDIAGVVRISFGIVSTFEDAYAALKFLRTFLG